MIFTITHKIFDDSIIDKKYYSVLHVGKNNNCKDYYIRDDTGDNISNKNNSYCELTGLYWIWKNYKEEPDSIIGFVHYRRFFTTRFQDILYTYFNVKPDILNYKTIEKALNKADIIVPLRVIIFRTVREFYSDLHIEEDLDFTREAIKKVSPESLVAFDNVMNAHYFYFANMMICKKNDFDDYCSWLFKVMSELELMIDISKYKNEYQKRVFGFISERLLQVWIIQKGIRVKEYPVFNTEEKRITFFKKNSNRLNKFIRKMGNGK